MNIWLCPVKPRSWSIIKKVKIFGAPKSVSRVFSQVRPGDLLCFYVLRPINRIVAIGKVTSQMFEDHQDIWGKTRYPLRVKIEIEREYLKKNNESLSLSALIKAKNPEIEIEPFLKNVWITKITKRQYARLVDPNDRRTQI